MLVSIATIALAAVPSALVVLDRWFRYPGLSRPFSRFRIALALLEQLELPPYFLAVFVCYAAVFALIGSRTARCKLPVSVRCERPPFPAHQPRRGRSFGASSLLVASVTGFILAGQGAIRKGGLPGWELLLVALLWLAGWLLREEGIGRTVNWHRQGLVTLSLGAAHVCLIGFLDGVFSDRSLLWVFGIPLLLSLGNLVRLGRSVPAASWLVLSAVVLYSINLDAWWFAAIGDDYPFYAVAREIQGASLHDIGLKIFSADVGVYGSHPYFSSLVHAVSLKLLGVGNFGWRFSNAYLSALAIGLFFRFFRSFLGHRIALWACCFLAPAHYLISFSKIGYNNLQAYFVMGLILAASAWAVRSLRPVGFVTLGYSLALAFYVYPGALYAVPLPLLLLWFCRRHERRIIPLAALASGSALIFLLPLFLQPRYWEAKLPGTLWWNPEVTRTAGSMISHVAGNLFLHSFPLSISWKSTISLPALSWIH